MSRNKGTHNYSANFEVKKRAPLDAKQLAGTVSDLITGSTWMDSNNNEYTYVGMIVSVYNDTLINNGLYQLIASDYTNINNWEQIGGSGSSVDTSLSSALSSEISIRTSADLSLSTAISTNSSQNVSLSTAVSTNVSQTTSLSSALSSEISTRISSDNTFLQLTGGTLTSGLTGTTLYLSNEIISANTRKITKIILTNSSIVWDMNVSCSAQVTLSGSGALTINNAVSGDNGTLIVIQGGSGSYTLTYPVGSKFSNGSVTLSTLAGSIDILSFFYDGTYYYWNLGKNYS